MKYTVPEEIKKNRLGFFRDENGSYLMRRFDDKSEFYVMPEGCRNEHIPNIDYEDIGKLPDVNSLMAEVFPKSKYYGGRTETFNSKYNGICYHDIYSTEGKECKCPCPSCVVEQKKSAGKCKNCDCNHSGEHSVVGSCKCGCDLYETERKFPSAIPTVQERKDMEKKSEPKTDKEILKNPCGCGHSFYIHTDQGCEHHMLKNEEGSKDKQWGYCSCKKSTADLVPIMLSLARSAEREKMKEEPDDRTMLIDTAYRKGFQEGEQKGREDERAFINKSVCVICCSNKQAEGRFAVCAPCSDKILKAEYGMTPLAKEKITQLEQQLKDANYEIDCWQRWWEDEKKEIELLQQQLKTVKQEAVFINHIAWHRKELMVSEKMAVEDWVMCKICDKTVAQIYKEEGKSYDEQIKQLTDLKGAYEQETYDAIETMKELQADKERLEKEYKEADFWAWAWQGTVDMQSLRTIQLEKEVDAFKQCSAIRAGVCQAEREKAERLENELEKLQEQYTHLEEHGWSEDLVKQNAALTADKERLVGRLSEANNLYGLQAKQNKILADALKEIAGTQIHVYTTKSCVRKMRWVVQKALHDAGVSADNQRPAEPDASEPKEKGD